MAKVRSSLGAEVDFDKIRIKQQLAETPQPVEVKAREDFIDQRLKRKARRQAQAAAKEAAAKVAADEVETTEDAVDAEIADTAEVKAEPSRKQKRKK